MKKTDHSDTHQKQTDEPVVVQPEHAQQEPEMKPDEAIEWKNKYLRALADYQNLEKRTQEQVAEVRQMAGERIIRQILPVGDMLSRAAEHLKDQGLSLTVKEFWTILEKQGIERISTQGKPFDPYEMECVEVVSGANDKVAEEVESGWKLHDKVIRAAKVKVGKSTV